MLITDFDGVIADALDECAMVTWYAHSPPRRWESGERMLAAVPPTFRIRFAALRPYARTLGHFAVALPPAAISIGSQAEFDRAVVSLGPARLAAFAAAAQAVRDRLRRETPEFWAGAHRIYPGIPRLLTRLSGRVHVLTAKDADSTWAVLEGNGLDRHVASVIADCADKAAAARLLCAAYGLAPQRAIFLDDSLANVLAVAATGVSSRWARWGWHTPEHEAMAKEAGVIAVDLSDLPGLGAQPAVEVPTVEVPTVESAVPR